MAAKLYPTAPFYMYEGAAFPSPEALLACRGVQRLAPLEEPMAQFYSEIGLHRNLAVHPSRVSDPAAAELFYVPVLPHLSADAGSCNGTRHRARMEAIAVALRTSPRWQHRNGSNHLWACACVMMKGMLGGELWELLATAMHAVHSVPRGRASPSKCQIAIPYHNPIFAADPTSVMWRAPGRLRPTLAHFRGRVMNRLRSVLVKSHGRAPNQIEAAHPSTAARCNLNKCSAKAKAKSGFPEQSVHFDEMKRAMFCLVPVGDSPPSSRLYMAIAAGCVPVFLSDKFEGAFGFSVPWGEFSLRMAEADVVGQPWAGSTGTGRDRKHLGPPSVNLTAHLLEVAADPARLAALQRGLQTHASSVLWEAPGGHAGHHALALATHALRHVCVASSSGTGSPAVEREPPVWNQPQVHFGWPPAKKA